MAAGHHRCHGPCRFSPNQAECTPGGGSPCDLGWTPSSERAKTQPSARGKSWNRVDRNHSLASAQLDHDTWRNTTRRDCFGGRGRRPRPAADGIVDLVPTSAAETSGRPRARRRTGRLSAASCEAKKFRRNRENGRDRLAYRHGNLCPDCDEPEPQQGCSLHRTPVAAADHHPGQRLAAATACLRQTAMATSHRPNPAPTDLLAQRNRAHPDPVE